MELSFKTKVEVDVDYDSVKPAGYEYESRSSSATVDYKVGIEVREWGIKSISYYGITQEISCYINLLEESTEETDSFLCKIQISEISTEGPEDALNRDLGGESLNLTITEITKSGEGFVAKATAVLNF